MRFGSTAEVLLKCKLKYYRISECNVKDITSLSMGHSTNNNPRSGIAEYNSWSSQAI